MITKYELSKTYQYRKVMKPLLERKRRARINDCLDELKELMVECVQQKNGDAALKLDKVDILELTVQHLRQLKTRKQQQQHHKQRTHCHVPQNSFRAGYIKAANEVSRCLAALPNVDVTLGTQLMTQLGLRLNQLEAPLEAHTALNRPLSITIGVNNSFNTSGAQQLQKTHVQQASTPTSMCSPVSSGYASDSDYSRCSPAPTTTHTNNSNQCLLQTVSPVWRPW